GAGPPGGGGHGAGSPAGGGGHGAGSPAGGVGLVDPVPDVRVPGAVGGPRVGARLLRRARVDDHEAGLARHDVVQPAADLLLGVGVVLPARLQVAQFLDALPGLLLLPLEVVDLGTLVDVLPHRGGEV